MNRNGTFAFAVLHPQRGPGGKAGEHLIKGDYVADYYLKTVFYYWEAWQRKPEMEKLRGHVLTGENKFWTILRSWGLTLLCIQSYSGSASDWGTLGVLPTLWSQVTYIERVADILGFKLCLWETDLSCWIRRQASHRGVTSSIVSLYIKNELAMLICALCSGLIFSA